MAKFVMLINWTDQGAREAKDTVARVNQASNLMSFLGGTFETILWTQGRFDLIGIVEAPSEEVVAAFTVRLASHGNVRTETLRAFTTADMERIIANVG